MQSYQTDEPGVATGAARATAAIRDVLQLPDMPCSQLAALPHRYRQSELQHARWAMLGVAGILVQEITRPDVFWCATYARFRGCNPAGTRMKAQHSCSWNCAFSRLSAFADCKSRCPLYCCDFDAAAPSVPKVHSWRAEEPARLVLRPQRRQPWRSAGRFDRVNWGAEVGLQAIRLHIAA